MSKITIIQNQDTWMEGEAIRQAEAVAKYSDMLEVALMPDAHPAKGSPNGAAFLSKDRIYYPLIGNDDGCGISLWKTDIRINKIKIDKLANQVNGLDELWDGDTSKFLEAFDVEPTLFDASLGTPGFGNHFIEFQAVVDIVNQEEFAALGMAEDRIHLMVHSGSRGFGESIMMEYAANYGATGVAVDSDEGQYYLKKAKQGVDWAMANRQLCAERALESTRTEGIKLIDICHNSVSEAMVDGCNCWLHRKGAAPTDKGPIVIAGSRNALSYVVKPIAGKESLWSLAHGAGRKISRRDAFGKLSKLYKDKDISKNKFGGRVICGHKPLLWEEAPECYKPIDSVIQALLDFKLIEVIATLQPLITFKTSEGVEEENRQNKKDWQQKRSKERKEKDRYR